MKRLALLPLALLLAATTLSAQQPGPKQPATPTPGAQKPDAQKPAQKRGAKQAPAAQPAEDQPPLDSLEAVFKRAQAASRATPARVVRVPDLVALVDAWLRGPATGPESAEKLEYLRNWLGEDLLRQQFALVAEDTTQPPLVRARALISLGQEHPTNVATFDYALDDRETTVRVAAAVGLKPVLLDPKVERSAVAELRRALHDPSPEVVSRALDALGDHDVDALRAFLATKPAQPLATVARQLVDLAESRGAPLVPRDRTGALTHAAAGLTLEFVPTQRWPQWDVAAGTLSVRRGSKAPAVLARDVEVVANVLPAAVSTDGRYVAYESAGHVHVRDLQSGDDRDVGAGIAPRIAPMNQGFLFARPGTVNPQRDRADLRYSLMFVPWSGGDARAVASVTASARQTVHGNASGMRWARIVEGNGVFVLTGDGLAAPVTLPDLLATHE